MALEWNMRDVKLLVTTAMVLFPAAITAELMYPSVGHTVGATVAITLGGFLGFLLTIIRSESEQIQLVFERAEK